MAIKKISTKKAPAKAKSTTSKVTPVKKVTATKVVKNSETKMDKTHLIKALRNMITARLTDEIHLNYAKQGKSFFHIGVSGHECIQTAIGLRMREDDWGWTYYRDMATTYAKGMTMQEYFLLAFAKKDCPASGGRQMPGHFGNPRLNFPTQSSPTGTQFLSAVGTALAMQKEGGDRFVYVASGEGTTSQGEFYEAVNWANRAKLPVLFCIQDNKFAISVQKKDQIMGGDISDAFSNYANLKKIRVDGTDYFESSKAVEEALKWLRAGKGPVLLHADVVRLLSHSSSDDHRKYRDPKEIEKEANEKDCIKILSSKLIKDKIATQKEIDKLWSDIREELREAGEWALQQEDPDPADAVKNNFADESTRDLPYATHEPTEGEEIVLVDAINHALHEEMARNDKMVIYGEDIEDDKGGVFSATKGLSNRFGVDRVFNSPLAEASIIGTAVGMAVKGLKPVVEIQFGDYIWPAFMQFKNEVGAMRFRSNGGFSAPVVTRVAVGGYIHGGLCHSQNIESIFSHIPGIMVAYPSNAADAKGLLKTACRLQDPVIFCEHKGMYRLPFARTIEPDENYLIPFGKAKIVKEGNDATIITYGMGVKDSLNAVKRLEKETNKTIEIIDLRTIVPWDVEAVCESVKKTSRALVVHEDTMTTSVSGNIISEISDQCFEYLDAPVRKLTGKDSHIPYHPNYENVVLPTEDKIYDMIKELIEY
jgi:2-oxoisovalerate dehydrogenase E1 component